MANIYDVNGNQIDINGAGVAAYDEIMKSINHRGFNTVAPENTIPAFKMSKQKGFKYVETDVRFSKDGIAVLIHDATIDKTARDTNGNAPSNVEVKDLTYEQLVQYDFGVWKSADYAGTKIPRFDDFITLCKNIGLRPYIELKAGTEAQIKSLVDAVKNNGIFDKVSWISFNASWLTYVKNYASEARIGYLTDTLTMEKITTAQGFLTGSNEVFINTSVLSAEAVRICKEANLPMEVYTIDSANQIRELNPYITGVTSNNLIAGKILYNSNIQ